MPQHSHSDISHPTRVSVHTISDLEGGKGNSTIEVIPVLPQFRNDVFLSLPFRITLGAELEKVTLQQKGKTVLTDALQLVRFSYMSEISHDSLEVGLLDALAMVQEFGDHEKVPISVHTVPLKDLAGFDSLTCVETTSLLSEKLGIEIKPKGKSANLFAEGGRALSVEQIINRLRPLVDKS